jgi:hypothetical protein
MIAKPTITVHSSAAESGYTFVRSTEVAVVSVEKHRDMDESLDDAFNGCAVRSTQFLAEWMKVLPRHRMALFCATSSWEPPNRVSRHRGVWKSKGFAPPVHSRRTLDVEITEGASSRFAGILEISLESTAEAAAFARRRADTTIMMASSNSLEADWVRTLAADAFPGLASSIHWSGLLEKIVGTENIYLKPNGQFDDRDVSIDFFLSAALLSRLAPS